MHLSSDIDGENTMGDQHPAWRRCESYGNGGHVHDWVCLRAQNVQRSIRAEIKSTTRRYRESSKQLRKRGQFAEPGERQAGKGGSVTLCIRTYQAKLLTSALVITGPDWVLEVRRAFQTIVSSRSVA